MFAAILYALTAGSVLPGQGRVTLMRTPEGGIQPQAAIDSSSVVHLIYYVGEAGGGDLYYVRRAPAEDNFSRPLKVNGRSGSAMAMGTIRGAQLAVGKNGRVHVAWDGMGKGAQPVIINSKETAPLLYTRLNDEGTAFEPERNLITFAAGLDGGSSVAADAEGRVYVTWQAPQPGTDGEAGRAVFIARSRDEGRTFQREARALAQPTGACPCCGMRAFADEAGAVYILFRGATEGMNRDEFLLVSERPGAGFMIAKEDPWRVSTCPMSSATLTPWKDGAVAAWETAGQVYFATVNRRGPHVSAPIAAPGEAARKHPVAVANRRGETLLAWVEGAGWGKPGALAWQRYDAQGRPTPEKGRIDGVPAWSLATAYTTPDDGFVIVY